MNEIIIGFMILCCIGIVFCFFMLWRNRLTYRPRVKMNEDVFHPSTDWEIRFRVYETDRFSYDTIFNQWWKPVSRFEKEWDEAMEALKNGKVERVS